MLETIADRKERWTESEASGRETRRYIYDKPSRSELASKESLVLETVHSTGLPAMKSFTSLNDGLRQYCRRGNGLYG